MRTHPKERNEAADEGDEDNVNGGHPEPSKHILEGPDGRSVVQNSHVDVLEGRPGVNLHHVMFTSGLDQCC